jgi:predicted lactoylglutathione lyase
MTDFATPNLPSRDFETTAKFYKALGFAQKALPKAPDNGNKMNVERMIKTLQEGKDIN